MIKFTAYWSYSLVNCLDVKVILTDRKIISDLYVEPTDTRQYLDSIMSPISLQKK